MSTAHNSVVASYEWGTLSKEKCSFAALPFWSLWREQKWRDFSNYSVGKSTDEMRNVMHDFAKSNANDLIIRLIPNSKLYCISSR